MVSVLVVAAALVAIDAAPAVAAADDPLRETGVVTRVVDGDTVMFREDGADEETRIRLAGIQAFELGECGADLATDRLTQLVEGEWVELRAYDEDSTGTGRPIRSLHLPLEGGEALDVTERLLLEGMGLWFPVQPEVTDTDDYHVAATHARRHGRGIWDDELCGRGPQPDHPIEMWVRSSADGNDHDNVNGEYVRIVNRHDDRDLDLSGWLLRESSLFRDDPDEVGYRFPSGTEVPPGESLVVRAGEGTNTALEHFMQSPEPIFDNADRSTGTDGRPDADAGMGDGAYLLDPLGNMRESFTYPCVVDCSTDLHGALVIDHVEYDPRGRDTADAEHVVLRNSSQERIHLDGYQLRNIWYAHEFELGTYLDPGERLTVTLGTGEDSRLEQYWGLDGPTLANSGDRVDVVSFDERFVDCVDWGEGRDCPWPIEVPGEGSSGELDSEVGAGPFGDVAASHTHAETIEWIAEAGITSGCGDGDYCPDRSVTRAQMATFLTAALDLEPTDPDYDDVEDTTHADGIGAITAAGITSGCGDGDYCPDRSVTRAQMATFLYGALE
ncbi:MAG: lamin tail domain-containing protein [Nitriliruptoraceae bacterium]